jgi:DMSO reductase family type II enzyme chaperone
MQTPSEKSAERSTRNEEWAAHPANPPSSIFGNYRGGGPAGSSPPCTTTEPMKQTQTDQAAFGPLQSAIDVAMARSFVYRFLARAYEDPIEKAWEELASEASLEMLNSAVRTLPIAAPLLNEAALALRSQFKPSLFEPFFAAYLSAFGHAARGRCPLNEIEYGDIKADPLFQPHRLADLAAFYRAFGLEIAEDADERQDHICLELEFMCVLAAKEAYALEYQLDSDALSLCRDAQKRFLREHLGRWTPAFTRRLARMAADSPLAALANFTRVVVEADCCLFGITVGSEDLFLRPVDDTAESLCNSCGVIQLPLGALPTATT